MTKAKQSNGDPKTHTFVVQRKSPGGDWSVEPPSVPAKPLDHIEIKAHGAERWYISFDPENRISPDEKNTIAFQIREHDDIPEEKQISFHYKFTVFVEGQIIDPQIIIDPPW